MLNPELAKKLMSDIPEMRDFVAYLCEESLKLNTIEDVKLDDPIELSVEIKARKRAYEKIVDILNPLVNVQEEKTGIKNEDYVV